MNGLILPQSTVQLLSRVPDAQRHPGLQLDKFSIPGNQMAQKQALDHVCRTSGDSGLLNDLAARRRSLGNTLPGYTAFRATTTSPLALHLARASALENAGICLHPLYGFAYLPGSGLKGMARAYAETIWLPAQSDQKQAWRDIEDVFGWAPHPDRRQQIHDPNHPAEVRRQDDHDPKSPEISASSGNIIFHDAWPESWPKLIVDIVNNHHPEYYQAEPNDNAHPPGDWENPVPVYFLAVPPGVTFTFPLAKRHRDVPDRLVELARDWLLGALCHLGAGAKTATGYGAFRPVEGNAPPPPSQRRLTFETTLELVTPAFLAGANQQAEDCDLRPATLRGLLRWWWRTMHAGFLDVKTLRALEAAIWGDTNSSGAVRILLEPMGDVSPQPYDKRSKANFKDEQKRSHHGIPGEDPRKVTQGLWYASYGMDETSKGQRKQRHYLEPGARWRLRLVARPTRYFANRQDASDPAKARQGRQITAEQALEQAKAALWLLCHFGGVGSKARKGFGSLAADSLTNYTRENCQRSAEQLRQGLGLPNTFQAARAESPSWQQVLGPVEVAFSWPNIWSVLDQVGFAYESAAHLRAHNPSKLALGLPRQIHGPRPHPLPHQNPATHRPPRRLHGPMGGRHASPVHIHIERRDSGWVVRVVAFPAAHLPDLNTSRTFLEEFLRDFGSDLQRRADLSPPSAPPGQGTASPSQRAPSHFTGPALPKPGERVEAVLLEEKTKKGGWKARHVTSNISGPIVNSGEVPADKKAGDIVPLIVQSANEREIAFRWPTAADEQRAQKSQGKPKGGPGGWRPRDR
ncbi:type III-B CRISPR module RAMP protein Cmr6 [Thermogemmata fonticola]|uniref:Type III-B CRISPR module RAMP protein Cmr6 n=1 Tax=Thermogemmata fonticola TaxID=2755323 RepID=A0A7V8VEP7_9BACT|nr:type III-B CRISPR module RAMP protein Cmr6 [Thermogemmata fonticola]MBA2226669.1 type III-B CRISPR module RAMP protein Cmr6 [Thermogemmata fonticola]